MLELNKIYNMDCLAGMKLLTENSIDTIITDPPYGLSFMNKKWDYDVPSIEIWKEALRVLKPGGHLLCFAGTRTQHRMATNIEDAGFEIRDMMCWLYGSGFPKGTDISKQIDKKVGVEREITGQDQNFGHGDSGIYQLNVEKPNKRKFDLKDKPATPEAQLWEGYKSALKPAFEPITVAMKPLDGTYAQNALKHGVAGLNIDDARIKCDDIKGGNLSSGGATNKELVGGDIKNNIYGKGYKRNMPDNTKGRFPANVILDEESAKLLDKQAPLTGQLAGTTGKEPSASKLNQIYNDYSNVEGKPSQPKDQLAGASRFFKVIKHDNIYTKSILNRKILDKLCYEHLDVKNVEKNLMIMNLIDQVKTNSVQRNVLPSLISQNKNLSVLFAEKKLKNIEIKHVQELVQILTNGIQEYMVTGQPFLTMYGLTHLQLQGIIILTQNLAYSVGREEKLDIMRIIQNLKILFGCVEVVTTNTTVTRFKYQAKASKSERNMGCKDLEEKYRDATNMQWKCNKCNRYQLSGNGDICKCKEPEWIKPKQSNFHPTVKPLKLMEYLCTITKTPTGGIVLDPFLGSGTTAMACKTTQRDYIGFELNEDYYNIALKRIASIKRMNTLF